MIATRALAQLQLLLGMQQVLTGLAERLAYEMDAALDRGLPDVVAFVHNREQVQQVMQWCAAQGVPLIARGAGTGLSGGAVAEHGGLILELARMDRILSLDPLGRSAVVEPGLVNLALDEAARRYGLYYPPDPASGRSATLGGNVAENAGGPHCFKYGVTTNYLTGLEFVLADGRALAAGGPAYDYPELDLIGLLTGSEGTLAVVTAITVRLLRQPPGVKTMMAAFPSVEAAGTAVSAVIAAGLTPSTLEMMDQQIARIVEEYVHPGLPLEAGAILIVEVDGYPDGLGAQMDEIGRILQAHGAYGLRFAQTAEERERLWYARKSAAGAMARLAPAYLLLDGTVPRSRLAHTLAITNQICARHGLRVGYVFHAGDGNLHPFILLDDPHDPACRQRAQRAGQEFMQTVVDQQGSITGEHGVGIEKRPYLALMYSPEEMSLMWDVKQVFDPHGLLNPGKIFPAAPPAAEPLTPVGAQPGACFRPTTAAEAAAGLRALSQAHRPVLICGGDPPEGEACPEDVRLYTGGLRGVTHCAPEDIYVTAGAGTTLAELQACLAPAGLQAALLAPWPQATLGGLLAANCNAPWRMRYGGLRDQVLALTLATADGRLIHAGRPVVKNVAGYDLAKALVGSYGTLGLIVEVTLKVAALPRLRRSVWLPVPDLAHGLAWARSVVPEMLLGVGLVLTQPPPAWGCAAPWVLVYSAEGLAQEMDAEMELVISRLGAAGAPAVLEEELAAALGLWQQFLGRQAGSGEIRLRLGLPPGQIDLLPGLLAELPAAGCLADVACGLVYIAVCWERLADAQAGLQRLRQRLLPAGGYAVVLDAPAAWLAALDRWGYIPSALDLMGALKQRWDPAGILNRGVFVV